MGDASFPALLISYYQCCGCGAHTVMPVVHCTTLEGSVHIDDSSGDYFGGQRTQY